MLSSRLVARPVCPASSGDHLQAATQRLGEAVVDSNLIGNLAHDDRLHEAEVVDLEHNADVVEVVEHVEAQQLVDTSSLLHDLRVPSSNVRVVTHIQVLQQRLDQIVARALALVAAAAVVHLDGGVGTYPSDTNHHNVIDISRLYYHEDLHLIAIESRTGLNYLAKVFGVKFVY